MFRMFRWEEVYAFNSDNINLKEDSKIQQYQLNYSHDISTYLRSLKDVFITSQGKRPNVVLKTSCFRFLKVEYCIYWGSPWMNLESITTYLVSIQDLLLLFKDVL